MINCIIRRRGILSCCPLTLVHGFFIILSSNDLNPSVPSPPSFFPGKIHRGGIILKIMPGDVSASSAGIDSLSHVRISAPFAELLFGVFTPRHHSLNSLTSPSHILYSFSVLSSHPSSSFSSSAIPSRFLSFYN